MKRKEGIDYIGDKKAYCYIEYSYNLKELPKALRMIADDCEKYQLQERILSSRSSYLGYSRPATKEELQNARDKEAKKLAITLSVLEVKAKGLGYKLVKI